MFFSHYTSLLRVLFVAALVCTSALPAAAQTSPITARGGRFAFGTSTDASYTTFVIPLDQQKGVQLDPMGFAPWSDGQPEDYYPWFFKIGTNTRYLLSTTGTGTPTWPTAVKWPMAAFGGEAGGSPMYVNQAYRFALYVGGQPNYADVPNQAILDVYAKADFGPGQHPAKTTHTFLLPHALSSSLAADWKQFGDNGFQKTFITAVNGVNVMETVVQFAMSLGPNESWGARYSAPLLITHRALPGAENYYFRFSCTGGVLVDGTPTWMAVSDPADKDSGVPVLGYVMNFESFPAWGSTLLKTPNFQGDPAPPTYYGKTAEEIAAIAPRFEDVLAGHLVTAEGAALNVPAGGTYQSLSQTPELQSHPKLDQLVKELGGDPLSIANYVHNEIQLTDPLGYNETGDVDEAAVNAGGMNRGALGTLLEGQGSPDEQCALLLYLLRKAGVQAAYVKPPHTIADGNATSPVKMLDQRLSNLLRTRIKEGQTPDGHTPVPKFIGVNYPWVAAYVKQPDNTYKWVHLFPWLKDTEVVEGLSIEGYLPSGTKSVREWTRKYLLAGAASPLWALDPEDHTAGNIFLKDLQKNLQDNWQGLSTDDIGVHFRNRRYNRTAWNQFPQPCQVDATRSYPLVDSLSADGKIYDTLDITIASVQNASKTLTMTGLRTLDLHNRRSVVDFKPVGAGNFNLTFTMEAFDQAVPGTTGDFSTSGDPYLRNKQQKTLAVTTADKDFTFTVVYHRHRAYNGLAGTQDEAALGGWDTFLGVHEFGYGPDSAAQPGAPITSTFHLGDLNAFCMNSGRVTDKMILVNLEPFWRHQQARSANVNMDPDYDMIEGTTAYLMGMSYFQRVARSSDKLQDLFKLNVTSERSHGFAQLGAAQDASGNPIVGTVNLPSGGTTQRLQHVYPVVDMNFFRSVWSGYGDLRPDAGGPETITSADFATNLQAADMSSLEDWTIRKYYPQENTDAVSTVNLFQRIQQDGVSSNDVLELDRNNCSSFKTHTYTFQGATRTLETWVGSANWARVEAAFAGWDKDLVRVYVTPGPVTGARGQWSGMGTLILTKSSGAALIARINGGYGSGLEGDMGYFPDLSDGESVDYSQYSESTSPPASTASIDVDDGEPAVHNTRAVTQPTSTKADFYSPSDTSASQTAPTMNAFASGQATLSPTDEGAYDNLVAQLAGGTLNLLEMATSFLENGSPIDGTTPIFSGVSGMAGDPVNMMTGELYADELDLVLPGPIPLQLRRNYGSQVLTAGEFGHGWKMTYFPYLFLSADGSKIHAAEPDGSAIVYTRNTANTTQQEWTVLQADNPMLSNGVGMEIGSVRNSFRNRLVRTLVSGVTTYTLYAANGSTRTYVVKQYPIPGTSITRSRPYLKTWADNVGNTLTFYFYGDGAVGDPWYVLPSDSSYGQFAFAKASNGNSMGFHYDTEGRILDAFTGDGRHISYRYDDDGDLRQVTLPDGATVSYDYLREQAPVGTTGFNAWYSTHLLNRETRPGGRIVESDYLLYAVNDLDSAGVAIPAGSNKIGKASHLRRVTQQRATVGEHATGEDRTVPAAESYKPVRNASYTYYFTKDAQGYLTGRTEILDAYNRKTIYYYVGSRLTAVADPLSTVTNVDTGAMTNPKMTQAWWTAADVAGGTDGAWEGALKTMQNRGGPITQFSYYHNGEADGGGAGGNVKEIRVIGELDGVAGTTETTINTVTYNSLGLPDTITKPDPNTGLAAGRKTQYFYDTAHARPYSPVLIEERDPGGTVIGRVTNQYEDVFSYTSGNIDLAKPYSKGLLHIIVGSDIGSDGATTTWTHDARGFVISKVAESGQSDQTNYPNVVTQFDYNLRGELTEERIMDGAVAKKANRYAYDDMGRRIWVERLDENRNQIAWDYTYYNLTGEVEWTDSSRTNPEDYTYTRYDGAGRPVEKTAWRSRAKADGSGVEAVPGKEAYSTNKFFYNLFGDLIKTMDPRGNTVKATYDDIGRKLSTTVYNGDWQKAGSTPLATETMSYNDAELSATSTDVRGGVTKIYVTSTGKPRLKSNPDGTQLAYTYYLDGRPKTEALSPTVWAEFAYNDVERTVTKTVKNSSATLGATTTVADVRGNIISSTDVAGLTSTATYDKLNRVITSVIPGAGATSSAQSVTNYYDATGFVNKTRNALGEYTVTSFDALGRSISIRALAANGTTVISQASTVYSADFNSVTTTKGSGASAISETTWTDTAGHTVLVKHADQSFATTLYDAAGNASASTNETGQTSQTTYDGLNRAITTVQADSTTTTFVYTFPAGGGQTVERRMPQGLTEVNSYDTAGRPTGKFIKGSDGSTSRNYSLYTYYPSGKEQGMLQSFKDPLNRTHELTYDQWLRPASIEIGTSGQQSYLKKEFLDYDVRGMVKQVRETTTPPQLGSTSATTTQITQVDRAYDLQGHLYDEKVSLGASVGSLAVATHLTESFNGAGRRTTLARGGDVASLGGSDSGGAWGFHYREDGMLDQVSAAGGSYNYTYGDNGLLLTRTNPFRTYTVPTAGGRDNRGRLTAATTMINGGSISVVSEALQWTADSKQGSYAATNVSSPDATGILSWTDAHVYTYDTQSRRLLNETFTPGPGRAATSAAYEFDHNTHGGLGIRTAAQSGSQLHVVGEHSSPDGWNVFSRVTTEVSSFEKAYTVVKGSAKGAKSVDVQVAGSSAGALGSVTFPPATARTTGDWSCPGFFPSGQHFDLLVKAAHPSDHFTAQGNRGFTLDPSATPSGVADGYDDEGQTTVRMIAYGKDSEGGRTQWFTWDGAGRLIRVQEFGFGGAGYEWSAVYDGLNRRIQTLCTPNVHGQVTSGQSVQERSWYDPGAEFLEVGIEVYKAATGSTERWWKVHGPDLGGGYGGLQGMGGLEALINEQTGQAVGIVDDAYGHIRGFAKSLTGAGGSLVANNTTTNPSGNFFPTAANQIYFEWHTARFSGYGPQAGSWSPSIADGVSVWRTFGWRGKRLDVTGFYNLGARYYEPNSGRFMSPDPVGHGSSMGLYDYAGGDPINLVDPRGRSPGQPDLGGTITTQQATEITNWITGRSDDQSSSSGPSYNSTSQPWLNPQSCVDCHWHDPQMIRDQVMMDAVMTPIAQGAEGLFEIAVGAGGIAASAGGEAYSGGMASPLAGPALVGSIGLVADGMGRLANSIDGGNRTPFLEAVSSQGPDEAMLWSFYTMAAVVNPIASVSSSSISSSPIAVETTTIYRGVNGSHADFAAQSTGVVNPNNRWWQFWKGEGSTPFEHNAVPGGTLNSPYTSWTTDPRVAENFALRPGPTPGVVIEAQVPVSRLVPSPNTKNVSLIQGGGVVSESEVLVRGTVTGIPTTVRP